MIQRNVSCVLPLVLLCGCTAPTIEGQIKQWGLEDYVQVIDPNAYREALLAYVFTMSSHGDFHNNVKNATNDGSFSQAEENLAQEAMSRDPEGHATVWKNARYGELKFIPGRSYRLSHVECRDFSVEWIFTGTFITKETQRGSACLNPQTNHWEWEG